MLRLAGKSALITGAARGIGRATAILFASEGAMVTLADRDGPGVTDVAFEIRADGGRAVAVKADVSIAGDNKAMVDIAEREFGRLDILFNNAGIMHLQDGDAEILEEAVWDYTMEVNLKSVWLSCRAGIPALRRVGGGSIINNASIAALVGSSISQLAYTASKGGVVALSRELAVTYANEQIRVNVLCPGPVDTKMLETVLDTDDKRRHRLAHIPMGRFGHDYEVAHAALWLASDDSSFVTGAELVVDGGIKSAFIVSR